MQKDRRAELDFGEEPQVDISGFAVRPPPDAPARQTMRGVAAEEGWPSREGPRPHWSRRTGRTATISTRVTPAAKAALYRVAAENRWGVGEALERLIEAYNAREKEAD